MDTKRPEFIGTPEEVRSWEGISACLKDLSTAERRAYVAGLAQRILPPEEYARVAPLTALDKISLPRAVAAALKEH